jgi:HEAT repeat protein
MAGLFAVTQASHGVGANAADALFFLRFGVEDLPLMILLSGPAVMATVFAHSAGLGRRGAHGWLGIVMGIATGWVALLWVGVLLGPATVYPVIWISTQALIYLTLTVVWNAAGAACTTRQAKRLFPLFATAAVAGGVVGNLSVVPLSAILGTQNLLVVQAVLLASATALVRRIGVFFAEEEEGSRTVRAELALAYRSVRSSRLLMLSAAVISLFFALFYLVVFPFSEVVTAEFPTEVELAGFLGFFSSVATAATFLFSLFVTGRLFSRMGLVMTLLIVPVVYAIGFSVWLVAFGLLAATLIRGLQWVVVNSVQTTAYSALFNVLSRARRGPVMALMTAVPAQLGTMAAGVILILAGGGLSQTQLFLVGLLMSLVALVVVSLMRPAYLTAVVAAVRRGLVGLWDAPATGVVSPIDGDVVQVLVSHLSDERPSARAIALAGLGRMGVPEVVAKVEALLDDTEPVVRAAAFEAVCQIQPDAVEPRVMAALDDESPEVRLNAVQFLEAAGNTDLGVGVLSGVLADSDPRVRAASAWLAGGEVGAGVVAEMIAAGDVRSLRAVLKEVGRHPHQPMNVDPLAFVEHDVARVRAAAIAAVASVSADPARIADHLEDPSLEVRRAAAEALSSTTKGRETLVRVLQEGSVSATEAALHALTPFDPPDEAFTEWAANEARRARFLASHRRVLDRSIDTAEGRFLVRVLGHRTDLLIKWVLMAMTTAKTTDTMPLVARGVGSGDEETKAAAIEALESVGDRSVLNVLLPLLEPVSDDEQSIERRVALQELESDFDPWLSALAARCLESEGVGPDSGTDGADLGGSRVASSHVMAEDHLETLDEMSRVLVLQRVPMFSELDPEDLTLIARSTTERRFEPGDAVYEEGDAGTELLVIVEGSAVVSRIRDGQRHVIEVYREGDHVGELSLLTGRRRSADVHAGTDGLHGLTLGKIDLITILEERSSVAIGMLGTMAGRLIEQT